MIPQAFAADHGTQYVPPDDSSTIFLIFSTGSEYFVTHASRIAWFATVQAGGLIVKEENAPGQCASIFIWNSPTE